MATPVDLSELHKEFGEHLKRARGDLTQRAVAPRTRTGKPATGTVSNWEKGTHLPASLQALQEHLSRIDRKNGPVPEEIREELIRLWNQITGAKTAQVDNGRLQKRRAAPVQGVPIGEWDAEALGVHRSITVGEETGLTPYLPRPHDKQLQARLASARDAQRTTMLIVVGGSCTGKTRTLYQAVEEELADWRLVAPRNDTDLWRLLTRGVPARTVVWLDELQRHLTTTVDGISATKLLYDTLETPGRGAVVFVGTIWPTNLAELESHAVPQRARDGGDEASRLLRRVQPQDRISVPDGFTEDEIGPVSDERLSRAVETALDDDSGTQRQVIQVLAGGTQLIDRLYGGYPPPRGFTQPAKAVLIGAAELRRAGVNNPLTRSALEGAAGAYLGGARRRVSWFQDGLTEATQAALNDHHDIRSQGVPALVPNSRTERAGFVIEAFDLHDYILSDNLDRRRCEPVAQILWDQITDISELERLYPDELSELAQTARWYGLIREESAVLWWVLRRWSAANRRLLVYLGRRGDPEALQLLRADTDSPAGRERLADALGCLADWGDSAARKELQSRAAEGDKEAFYELHSVLVAEQGTSGWDAAVEMTGFTPVARRQASPLELGSRRASWRSRAEHLYCLGDVAGLARLKEVWDEGYVARRCARLLIELDRVPVLREMTASRAAHNQLLEYDKVESLDETALRIAADHSITAARAFALRLCRRGELGQAQAFADQGSAGARSVLVRHFATRHQEGGLRACVRAGYGDIARDSLCRLYQHRTGRTGPVALDVSARPV